MAANSAGQPRVTRRKFVAGALAAPAIIATSKPVSAAEAVSLGMVNTISDAGIKTLGLVKGNVAVADVIDMSFAQAAVAELGPYRKARPG
jgi:enoyl-CoA hydratase/carnithine racemase